MGSDPGDMREQDEPLPTEEPAVGRTKRRRWDTEQSDAIYMDVDGPSWNSGKAQITNMALAAPLQ